MSQAIRDAAQALLEVCNGYGCTREMEIEARKDALRSALAAPQPTADERLERLLADVEMYGHAHAVETRNDAFRGHESMAGRPQYDLPAMFAAVEQSARALLSASQEDAEMLDWVMEHRARLVQMYEGAPVYIHAWVGGKELHGPDAATPREAIRAAMKEQKT